MYTNGGEQNITGLNGAFGITLSADNAYLYVASENSNAVVAFSRNISTGELTYLRSYINDFDGIEDLSGASTITLIPNGNRAYVTGFNDNAFVVFDRDPATGLLNFKQSVQNGTNDITTLEGVTAILTSPDDKGEFLYTAARLSDAVSVFSTISTDVEVILTSDQIVAINNPLTYTITVTNSGLESATGITLTDTLPFGSQFSTVEPADLCSADLGGKVNCVLGTLEPEASTSIKLTITTPATVGNGILINAITVNAVQVDINPTNNKMSFETQLVESLPKVELTLELTVTPETVTIDSPLVYAAKVTNQGPDSATDIRLTQQLAAGMTYNATDSDSRCTVPAETTILCQLEELSAKTSETDGFTTFEIHTKTPNTPGTIKVTTEVQTAEFEQNPADNTASHEITVNELKVDLALADPVATPTTASTPLPFIEVNQNFAYTMTINNNADVTAREVVLTADLSPALTYISGPDTCDINNFPKVICNLGNVGAKSSRNVQMVLKGIQTGENLANHFNVTTNKGLDDLPDNNSSTGSLNIRGQLADLVVTVDDGGQAVSVEDPVTYTITVTNNGPNETSANLQINLQGPNVAIGPITGEGCGTGNEFSCTLGTITAGQNQTVTFEATPTLDGNLQLTAEAIGTVFDPSLPNKVEKTTAVSNKRADLSLTLKADPNPAIKEKNITYTTTLTNQGPEQALGVTVTQALPPSVKFVSAQSSQGACTEAEGTVTCLIGPLNVYVPSAETPQTPAPSNPQTEGETEPATPVIEEGIIFINVVVAPTTIGKIESTVNVTGSTVDSNSENNQVTLEITVDQLTADLQLMIEDAPDPGIVNNPLTYRLTLTNNGPDVATNINLTNQLPQDVLYQSRATITPLGIEGHCNDVNEANEVVCTLAALPKEATATVSLTVQPLVAGDLIMTNSFTLNEFDPDNFKEDGTLNVIEVPTRINYPSTLFFIEAIQNGVGGTLGLENVSALTLSPDGEYLYAAGFGDNALVVFRRNTSTGQLKFTQALFDDTNDMDGLYRISDVSLSPDGAYVYTASLGESAVAVFQRDESTGTLTFVEVLQNGVNELEGLGSPLAILTTTQQVYVAANSDDAIVIFNRNENTGKLTFNQTVQFSDEAQTLDGIDALTLSDDGLFLFATSANADRLSMFSRDPNNGTLNLVQTLTNNIGDIQGLDKATNVVASPDGQHVYTTGADSHAVTVFSRDPDTGSLTLREIHYDNENGIEGIAGAADLAISPDGRYVYVVGSQDHALVAFRRDPETGQLTFVDILRDGIDDINGLGQGQAIALSPNGAHLYVAGFGDSAIGVFTITTTELSVVISDTPDPVQTGAQLIYNLTVTNNGPHQATGVTLADILPSNFSLISVSASQGSCVVTATNKQINCALGTLDNEAQLSVSIVGVVPKAGELSNEVTVTANEFDPSPTAATENTLAVAEADLLLNLSLSPEPAQVLEALTYNLTVTNNGPDPAVNVIVSGKVPTKVAFVSAQAKLGSETIPCFFDELEQTISCTIPSLAAGVDSRVTLVVTPNTEGAILTNTMSVISDTFDSDLANNQQTKTTEVTFKVIEDVAINNNGKNLHNYLVKFTGAIVGGSVSGRITNQGLVSDVWILPNTTVTGGTLSKEIVNEGVIENVQLLSDTIINGGMMRGKVSGFLDAPATLNTQILAETELAQVIIGPNSHIDPQAILGENVVFTDNNTLSEGLDLTGTLPKLVNPITRTQAVNLATDVLVEGKTLLEQLNAIPTLIADGLEFTQILETGQLWIPIGAEKMVLMPTQVTQASRTETPSMTIHVDGSVTFITEMGRKILAQPTAENLGTLQTGLENLGFTQFKVASDGNLLLFGDQQLVMRPDSYTQEAADFFKPFGLERIPSTLIDELTVFLLTYVDETGQHRQQYFYPVSAHPEELLSALRGYPGATSVNLDNSGKVSVKIGNLTYAAVLDYIINPGHINTITQFLLIPDKNGDGSEEVRVIYANGDQQLLYLMPFPEMAEEIQGIDAVQAANYIVSQTLEGHLLLMQNGTFLVAKTVATTQLDENTPSKMTIQQDGTVEFITETGQQIIAQPVVQDLAALNTQLALLELPTITIEDNGNLTVIADSVLSYSARPYLASYPSAVAMSLGLHRIPTSLPGVKLIMLVFRDDTGNKREQMLFPAPRYPKALQAFLANMPGVESVALDYTGTVSVKGGSSTFKGIFDYAVQANHIATGGIQLTIEPDVNGDGIEDFALIYGNGEKQLIFQLP
jgi:uncharacterized repeat protein (TIGR01451 family)